MKIQLNRNFSVISLSILSLLATTESGFALQALDDQTLGNETGQAAFYTNYIDPTAAGNITTSSSATISRAMCFAACAIASTAPCRAL